MSKKKKIIILSCMVALLAVTAVFNFVLSGNNQVDDVVTTANYFSQYKTERTASRSEQLLLLDETIANAGEDETVKTNALEMKLKLTSIIEQELLLEKLIQAKGYTDSVVSIGLTSDNVNVIVKDDNFDQDDAIIIYTILAEEANATPENVKIIPIS
ncbi:MAG: SpoIIIAH-like family protein [Clostridia bacterium]|nr:SpoIIIAH-like family protein [Clostridia bacterium]